MSSRASSRAPSQASSRANVESEKVTGSKEMLDGLSLQGRSATSKSSLPKQKRGSVTGSDRIKEATRPGSAQSNSSRASYGSNRK